MPKATIAITYIAGVSKEIRRVCSRHDVKVAFRASRTLCSLLTRVKDLLLVGKQSMVVYQIPCSCSRGYIGKTIQQLKPD